MHFSINVIVMLYRTEYIEKSMGKNKDKIEYNGVKRYL